MSNLVENKQQNQHQSRKMQQDFCQDASLSNRPHKSSLASQNPEPPSSRPDFRLSYAEGNVPTEPDNKCTSTQHQHPTTTTTSPSIKTLNRTELNINIWLWKSFWANLQTVVEGKNRQTIAYNRRVYRQSQVWCKGYTACLCACMTYSLNAASVRCNVNSSYTIQMRNST